MRSGIYVAVNGCSEVSADVLKPEIQIRLKLGLMPLDIELAAKQTLLYQRLSSFSSLLVAYSGGVDSALLLKVATA